MTATESDITSDMASLAKAIMGRGGMITIANAKRDAHLDTQRVLRASVALVENKLATWRDISNGEYALFLTRSGSQTFDPVTYDGIYTVAELKKRLENPRHLAGKTIFICRKHTMTRKLTAKKRQSK